MLLNARWLSVLVLLPALSWGQSEPSVLRWRTATTSAGRTSFTTPYISKSILVVASGDIRAYSSNNGEMLWHYPLTQFVPRTLIGDEDQVYVTERIISALDLKTGKRRWAFDPDSNTSLGAGLVHDKTLYVGTDHHSLYAIDCKTGLSRWHIDLDPTKTNQIVVRGVTLDGETLYVTAEDVLDIQDKRVGGVLYALDSRTGARRWTYRTAQAIAPRQGFSTSIVKAGDALIVGDALSNALVAIGKDSHTQLWRFTGQPGYVGFSSTPLLLGDKIYAASGDTNVYAVTSSRGQLVWKTSTGGSNLALIRCGATLVDSYQKLAFLDIGSGTILRRDVVYGASEFVTSDIVTSSEQAYAFGATAIYSFDCTAREDNRGAGSDVEGFYE